VSGRTGTTIHRLLGYDGKSFSKDSNNPINADMLIIDEFSMVDVPLAWHLFNAVDFARTAIVIVGDHNQLPPVGPGNILRDLIHSNAIPSVILDKVVRQAGVLKENSTAILKGEVRKTSDTSTQGCQDWYLADQFTDPGAAHNFLLDLFDKRLDALGFDPLFKAWRTAVEADRKDMYNDRRVDHIQEFVARYQVQPEEDGCLKEVLSRELFVALKRVARDFGLRFEMDSSRQFAQRFANDFETISEAGFEVVISQERYGTKLYTIQAVD